jgi:hypothetical protein
MAERHQSKCGLQVEMLAYSGPDDVGPSPWGGIAMVAHGSKILVVGGVFGYVTAGNKFENNGRSSVWEIDTTVGYLLDPLCAS